MPANVGDVVFVRDGEQELDGVVLGFVVGVEMRVDFDGEVRSVPLVDGGLPAQWFVRTGPPEDPDEPLSPLQEIELAAAKVTHPTARES